MSRTIRRRKSKWQSRKLLKELENYLEPNLQYVKFKFHVSKFIYFWKIRFHGDLSKVAYKDQYRSIGISIKRKCIDSEMIKEVRYFKTKNEDY